MSACFVDLVMDDGNLVRIECPAKREDDLHDSLDNARLTRATWSPAQFDGCTATYLGYRMGRVNMAKCMGML